MIGTALLSINIVAALVVFVVGIMHANQMSGDTRHAIRLAWIVMTTGAAAVLIGPLFGYGHPAWQEVLLNTGVALFVLTNRRWERRRLAP